MRQWASLLFLAGMVAAAQQTLPAPTFRAGTKLVQVDVVVRDKNGPAAGLTKQDFTLLDNGKPQEIAVFSVRSSSFKSAETSGRPAVSLPPGAVSNRLNRDGEVPATTTVILVDQKNTQRTDQAYAIQRIVKFIEKRRKRDRIGIYTFGRDGMQSVQELTDDPDLLRRAANSLKPQAQSYADGAGMTGRAAEEFGIQALTQRVTDTKHALEAIARHFASAPGRKNLIWVTASFPLIIVLPDRVVDFTPDMEEAARALNNANLALYAVDARGLIGALSTAIPTADTPGTKQPPLIQMMRAGVPAGPSGIDTMNKLAGLTGGDVYFNTNGIEDSIQTAVEDAELTYTVGFYSAPESKENASKDRDVHKLKVKVARAGASVRYRENYSASIAPADATDRPTLDQLLRDSLDATQLGLFAETAPDQAHPGSYHVRLSVDLHNLKLDRQDASWVGALDVSFFVEGSKAARTITERIQIPEDQLAASLEKPIVVETSIALEAPTGVLRIVAQDQATGAAGSLRVPLGSK